MQRIEPHTVERRADGSLFCPRFDDVYFSAADGLAETHHVFLAGNDLPQRFVVLRGAMTIGELGFGTGLNFLATWRLFDTIAPPHAQLDYVAVEKHPFEADALQTLHAQWPQLDSFAACLTEQYPPLIPGLHRVALDDGRVRLTLCFGDVAMLLPQLSMRADAWFLDGFAPDRNADMWSLEVLHHVARLTASGGTCATYTAAGHVRRALADAGFAVERIPGFATKRHMLCGAVDKTRRAETTPSSQPWFECPPAPTAPDEGTIIIGAGIAGCAVARALAKRGRPVTILDRKGVAAGATGIGAAVIEPVITSGDAITARFYTSAYSHASRVIAASPCSSHLSSSGVRHVDARPVDDDHPIAPLVVTHTSGDAILSGGCVNAPELCCCLLDDYDIEQRMGDDIRELERDATDRVWLVHTTDSAFFRATSVIIACAAAWRQFAQLDGLPVAPVRGQVTLVPATRASRALDCVHVFGDGYITPADREGMHTLGATFDRDSADASPRSADNIHNINRLRRALPELAAALDIDSLDAESLHCRAGVRATLPDRLPAVGPVPDAAAFARDYGDLHHGRPPDSYPRATCHDGLYVSTGHGSRGITTALLAGELIASMITNAPLPLERDLVHAIHPARFLIRKLRTAPQHRA